jgi:Putative Actinobacterial Holin-X, holin superfamily III
MRVRSTSSGPEKSTSKAEAAPEELLGQLAHELSLLVRADVELAAAEQLHTLRRLTIDAAVLVVAAVSGLLAIGAFTWAAVRAVGGGSQWDAPLIVGGGWLLVSIALLSLEHPRRLLRKGRRDRHEQIIQSQRRARDQAEQEIRQTSQHLVGAVLREATARELEQAASLAERELSQAEEEVRASLSDLVEAFTAPGRAGLSLLDRLIGSNRGPRADRSD